ncbi:hypothetical protein ACFYZJ_30960 [Streptomyces sp. NPDC001848]|uniref:hypothetical protein n=1 Tax=Streptomyces sp. NPDC001848 TaxID=3364618 RepID=UPI003682328F
MLGQHAADRLDTAEAVPVLVDESGEPIETPAARERPRRVADGLLRLVPPTPTEGWAKPVTGGSGSSVYAIPAGLPRHGRRR